MEKRLTDFQERVKRTPGLPDYLMMLALAFGASWISFAIGNELPEIRTQEWGTLVSNGTWKYVLVTTLGIILSFTPARNLEGVGASKIGSVMIYLLVACIGASANFKLLAEAPGDAETLLVGEIELPERDPGHAPELWESVICWKEPIRPTPKVLDPVAVVVRPGDSIAADDVKRIRSQGVRLLVVNAAPDGFVPDAERFDIVTPDHVGAVCDLGIGKVGCVMGEGFRCFDRVRLLALGGAELVCVFDAPDDVRLMRARAMENRTFILAVGREIGAIVSPSGELLAYSSRPSDDDLMVEINVADAAVKTVAPHTDIWEQRRVDAYK